MADPLEGDRVRVANAGPLLARQLGVPVGSDVRGTVVGFSSSLSMLPRVRTSSGQVFYADPQNVSVVPRSRRTLAGSKEA